MSLSECLLVAATVLSALAVLQNWLAAKRLARRDDIERLAEEIRKKS